MSAAQAYYVVSHPKKDKNISRCPSCEYHSMNFIAYFVSIPQTMQFSKVHFPAVNYFSKSLSYVPCVYLTVLLCASKITAPEGKSFFRVERKGNCSLDADPDDVGGTAYMVLQNFKVLS
jgi:hypothetical protein